jgi:hypothetical protein
MYLSFPFSKGPWNLARVTDAALKPFFTIVSLQGKTWAEVSALDVGYNYDKCNMCINIMA